MTEEMYQGAAEFVSTVIWSSFARSTINSCYVKGPLRIELSADSARSTSS
jgi:hypothetical protein